ncbi:tRNA pseudouridine(55) synthase TruB [Mycobacterium sp. 050272]|uniref:tRNA pseudouridine(55) synthase TruB n=1 Tax=Mycobacterium sp. 050272 TaxID=3142488 RepID=UPI0031924378
MNQSPTGPGLVVVDKPAGMTSHDVVGRCRRIFSTRRVGHAGTLDPMATGVLVIGVDRATKLLGLLTASEKSYGATIRLGQTTTTEDAEGELLQTISAAHVTDRAIADAIAGLRGDIEQVPSAVSAIKVDGKRAYQRVREGETVELKARPVRIDRFEVCETRRCGDVIDLDVDVDCSSGTYVRALARDLGTALGVGGHLTALRRTRVGRFGLDQALTLDELAQRPRLSQTLDEACLLVFPRRVLTPEEAEATSHGRPLSPAAIDGVYAASDDDGRVIALLRDEGSRTRSVVVLRPATMQNGTF